MSTMMKSAMVVSVLAASVLSSSAAMAGASANVGFASDYIFRGVYQAESSASAGLDYNHDSGLYVGTWAADVNKGIEYDIYGGYAGSMGDLSYGIGATGYYYSDDFDGAYEEINLSVGYGPISVTHNVGSYDGSDVGAADYDYTFSTIKAEYKGLYALLGTFGDDADGSYTQVGYDTEVSGISVGGYLMKNDEDLDLSGGDGETRLVFTVGKSFDL